MQDSSSTPTERARLAKYALAQLLLSTAPLGEKRIRLHFPRPLRLGQELPILGVAACKFDIRNFTASARNLAQHQETVHLHGPEPTPAYALALFTDAAHGEGSRDDSFSGKPWTLRPEFYEGILAHVKELLSPDPTPLLISSRQAPQRPPFA